MKRTLTAAATLLAGSAGAVGFAGTAAADTPQLPAELPVDNSVAQTAYHAAGTVHSAKGVVGDVVPMGQQLTSRAAPPSGGGLGGGTAGDLGGGLGGLGGGDGQGGGAAGGLGGLGGLLGGGLLGGGLLG